MSPTRIPSITPERNRLEEILMPTDTQRVRLTEETYDRARIELAMLRMERATGSIREHTDPEQRAVRIRQLQELISSAAVGHEPPDDGVAHHVTISADAMPAGTALQSYRRSRVNRSSSS
jgi:hypothetical protein